MPLHTKGCRHSLRFGGFTSFVQASFSSKYVMDTGQQLQYSAPDWITTPGPDTIKGQWYTPVQLRGGVQSKADVAVMIQMARATSSTVCFIWKFPDNSNRQECQHDQLWHQSCAAGEMTNIMCRPVPLKETFSFQLSLFWRVQFWLKSQTVISSFLYDSALWRNTVFWIEFSFISQESRIINKFIFLNSLRIALHATE